MVVTGGHPGDPEYGCGGTIARYTDLGHEVVLLYLNRGEWPEDPQLEDAKSVRMAEARKACEILKARPVYAGQINGLRSWTGRITEDSIACWKLSTRTWFLHTGPLTTTPTTAPSRSWSTRLGYGWQRVCPLLL